MDEHFELKSGNIIIGDPVMGLAHYDLSELSTGTFVLEKGALISANEQEFDEDLIINLDGPYIFVLDALKSEQFENWFHEVGNECSYIIPEIVERLDEVEKLLGYKVGFYWEEDIGGEATEGCYSLDISRVKRVTEQKN